MNDFSRKNFRHGQHVWFVDGEYVREGYYSADFPPLHPESVPCGYIAFTAEELTPSDPSGNGRFNAIGHWRICATEREALELQIHLLTLDIRTARARLRQIKKAAQGGAE